MHLYVAHMVDIDAVCLSIGWTQRATERLSIAWERFCRPSVADDFDGRHIKSFSENIDVDQLFQIAAPEFADQLVTDCVGCFGADRCGWHTGIVERLSDFRRRFNVDRERDAALARRDAKIVRDDIARYRGTMRFGAQPLGLVIPGRVRNVFLRHRVRCWRHENSIIRKKTGVDQRAHHRTNHHPVKHAARMSPDPAPVRSTRRCGKTDAICVGKQFDALTPLIFG